MESLMPMMAALNFQQGDYSRPAARPGARASEAMLHTKTLGASRRAARLVSLILRPPRTDLFQSDQEA